MSTWCSTISLLKGPITIYKFQVDFGSSFNCQKHLSWINVKSLPAHIVRRLWSCNVSWVIVSGCRTDVYDSVVGHSCNAKCIYYGPGIVIMISNVGYLHFRWYTKIITLRCYFTLTALVEQWIDFASLEIDANMLWWLKQRTGYAVYLPLVRHCFI